MKSSSLSATLLAGAVMLTGTPVLANAVANDVPISITWRDPVAPKEVTFEGNASGEAWFKPVKNDFIGTNRGQGEWMSHAISIHFPSFSIPFVLRTQAGKQGPKLHVQRWEVSCTPDAARRIGQAHQGSSQRDIISAIITARYLAQLPTSTCPEPFIRQMKQRYFILSCNFSKSARFFGLSADAMKAYRESTVDGAAQAQSCLTQSRGLVVANVDQSHRTAIANRDWALAERLEGELRRMSGSQVWSAAFHKAAMLTEDTITSRAYVRRYQQSLEASRAGDFSTALELNKRLQEELASGTGRIAFGMASINNRRLADDQTYFETRMEASQQRANER